MDSFSIGRMKVGDTIRLVGIPPNLKDDAALRRSRLIAAHRVMVVALVAGFMFVLSGFAQTQQRPPLNNSLEDFLRSYIGVPTKGRTTRYSAAFVDLRDDGTREAIVYLTSDGWCGTGGCTLLILAPEGASYSVITKIPGVRLPVRVLAATSNGWHDISVVTGKPLYEAVVPFDGETYPSSASMPPAARPASSEVPGRIVMPVTAEDKPLFK